MIYFYKYDRSIAKLIGIIFFVFCGYLAAFSQPIETPEKYRSHPEYGKTKLLNPFMQNSVELIHERTSHSRLFMNAYGSYTIAKSDMPLHYIDAEGWWRTIDLVFETQTDNPFLHELKHLPVPMSFNSKTLEINAALKNNNLLTFGKNISLIQYDSQGNILSHIEKSDYYAEVNTASTDVVVTKIFDGIDLIIDFGFNRIKTNFIILCTDFVLNETETVVFRDIVEVPSDWVLHYDTLSGVFRDNKWHGNLILHNEKEGLPTGFVQPVFTDASNNRDFSTLEGAFKLEKIDENKYHVDIIVPSWWLKDNARVFPIIIDPIVVFEDTFVMNSCFHPTYQQSTLSVNVPVGDFISNTYLLWEFEAVDGSGAWTEDQRSYVTSTNGQTAVFSGVGQTHGTQTYQLNTSIANGASIGSVDFTFHASRVWGGSGCNTTFNFIKRRYIEVTHDTLTSGSSGHPLINEYSCSNRSMSDNFGNYEDWVELYNPTAGVINLTGYYLSDNPNNPLKWRFPGGIIQPFGHLTVICSGRDSLTGAIPHTNFRLTQLKPESILLSDTAGNLLEEYTLFVTQNGHSYGRIADGDSIWGIFTSPTQGAINTNAFAAYTETPILSPGPGFYSAPVTLSMSTNEPNAEIRYTTNGSIPTSSSTLYTGPVTISNTSVIRARTFSNNPQVLPGFIETNSYFINENHTLPIFSFSGNHLNTLFGGSQITTIGAFEFFDEHGNFIDASVGDFDKHGNDSWSYPQRGVDFVARDEYGYNNQLTHKFFATSDRTKFQRLMVKAAANDNYPFESGGAHIRDSYIQSLSQLIGLDLDERSSTSCILYVNGQYWGVYDLREKVDDTDFTDYYYGQDRKYKGSEEYIQFLKTWGATQAKYGEQRAIQDWAHLRNFIANNNMGDSTNFAYVENLLNMESFIDYFVFNSFVVSRDWLNYNTGWWRGLDSSGSALKWRYILWDMEGALGHFHNYTGLPNVSATAPPCQVENITVGNGHAQSLKKLINENPNVRQHYVTRYADLLNTHLSCAHMIHVFDSMVNVIAPEMPRQVARWGGNMTTWQNNVQNVRNFINQRCTYLIQGLSSCYSLNGPYNVHIKVEPPLTGTVKMNSVWLPSYPFDAFIFGGIETKLVAQGLGPYQFSHWEIPQHTVLPNINAPEVVLNVSQTDTVIAHFHNPGLHGKQLLYYWHFNELETPQHVVAIDADYKLLQGTNPQMVYTDIGASDMDVYNTGSDINLQLFEDAGKAARVRNPSFGRSLLFNMPTSGYGQILFEYAVHRSAQGMLNNIISYSTDGINFIQTGLSQNTFSISEDYSLITVDFSGIHNVNNNPDFHVMISFEGNHNQVNGNNRFDNITLKGKLFTKIDNDAKDLIVDFEVYPNPFKNTFTIIAGEPIEALIIYDLLGNNIYNEKVNNRNSHTLYLSNISKGMYFIDIKTANGQGRKKIIKN